MNGKILLFDKNVNRYRKLADVRSEKEDFSGALAFLTSARHIDCNLDVLIDIADAYADMGVLELSNKFWFKYLDKAPKEKLGMAYEELAINYFYLDNFWASSYYFHQKLSVDGYIAKEGLNQEIIDFFSGEEFKKLSYRVVYPIERADFSYEYKRAKHAMAVGAFEEGAKILSSVPFGGLDEEHAGDLAVCYFMTEKFDEAEEICRKSLDAHGENVTAYCNLSTIYDMKEDFNNSEFYYRKALNCVKGEKSEAYKLATCAIEREDHAVAADCLNKILLDRPYEITMRFFYGLALANLKKFDRAEQELKEAYSFNPDDVIVKYYYDYVCALAQSKGDIDDLMPFKYVKEIPEKITKKWEKIIDGASQTPERAEAALKKQDTQKIIEWAIFHGNSQTMRTAVYILSLSNGAYAKNLLREALLDPDGSEELKRVLVYVLIMKGIKEKTGVVAGSFYLKLKPKKLACEKQAAGNLYLSAYALCMSRVIFYEVDDLDKIAKACDKVYKKFKGLITEAEASNEEIAALILLQAATKRFSKEEDVARLFAVSKEKLKTLNRIFKGEKND